MIDEHEVQCWLMGELPKIDPDLACRCDDDNFSSFFVGRAAMIQGLAGKFAPD